MNWLHRPTSLLRPPGRRQVLLGAALIAAALHAVLLAWPRAKPKPVVNSVAVRAAALATRSIDPPHADKRLKFEPPAMPSHATRSKPNAGDVLRPQARAAAPVEVAEAAPSDARPEAPPLPVYATRFAPAAVLDFELKRGAQQGTASLSWQPAGAVYQARLDRTLAGRPLQSWVSSGGFDAAGLAPVRQVDERRGRPQRATNFRRDQGLISFSSSTAELPLPPGAQDHLSWMLQLSAIVAAAPQGFTAGQSVLVPVASPRGRVEVWTFAVQAVEALDLPAGMVPAALRLQRQREAAYEPSIEVWLDPQRHYLPVRLRWSQTTGDVGLEMNLQKEAREP